MATIETPPLAAEQSNTADLGLLAKLPGRWTGRGFNLIARPDRQGRPGGKPFFLQLNAMEETLDFTAVARDVPNRGSIERNTFLRAVHYLQTVTDLATHQGIHEEPGLWAHVPITGETAEKTYVRMATIPHGDSLLAQSTLVKRLETGPVIQPVNSFPFEITDDIPDLNGNPAHPKGSPYIDPYLRNPLPDGLPKGLDAAKAIKDPTEILRADIQGQTITQTDVIAITTKGAGGILNIPFVKKNANAAQMDAIFWIETVKQEDSDAFLQLQYVQRVMLEFEQVRWPHITVATLKQE
jgi:hypothetical protein